MEDDRRYVDEKAARSAIWPSVLSKEQLTREEWHLLLDVALDAKEGSPLLQSRADEIGWRFCRELFSGMARILTGDELRALADCGPGLDEARSTLAHALLSTPSGLPQEAREAIAHALWSLSDGSGKIRHPFFSPRPKEGNGVQPAHAHYLEEAMLRLKARMEAQGLPAEEAKEMLADAVSQSVKVVEKWRSDWNRRAGAKTVRRILDAEKAQVEWLLSGGSPLFGLVREPIGDGALAMLAADWRRAKAPAKA